MQKTFYILILKIISFFEKIIFANFHLLFFLVRYSPSDIFLLLSRIKVVGIYYDTLKHISAYKYFLAEKISQKMNFIENYEDFVKNVPYTTKENYVYKYNLLKRCRGGKFPKTGGIDESAGSTGIKTMWVRSADEEVLLYQAIKLAMEYSFKVKEKESLVILNCWSIGPWVTGAKFTQLVQPYCVVKNVGTNKVNAVDTILELGSSLDYLLCGYPPFIKEILDYGESRGVDWSRYKVSLLTGGEGFSEGWREYVISKFKKRDMSVVSGYGASDIDIGIGFETRTARQIKGYFESNIELRKKILGFSESPVFVGQYNPLIYHIENGKNGNLIFTTLNPKMWTPRVRYDLFDFGKVLSYKEMEKFIRKELNVNLEQNEKTLKLPFIVVYGRCDGTISLDGANIYPSDIQNALYKSNYAKYVNSFFLDTGTTKDHKMYFKICIELPEYISKDKIPVSIENEFTSEIKDHLVSSNADYKESYENNPDSLLPHVKFFNKGEGVFKMNENRIKKLYYLKDNS